MNIVQVVLFLIGVAIVGYGLYKLKEHEDE
jgi:hypothetical protein